MDLIKLDSEIVLDKRDIKAPTIIGNVGIILRVDENWVIVHAWKIF